MPTTNSDTPSDPHNSDSENRPTPGQAIVPAFTRWALRIGGGAALVCGAILSFFALYGLAVLNGWPRYIAWALPGSVDVLTATAAVVAMSVPREHRGARIAHWCAGVSLVITVGCNVEYHALLPAHWTTGHIFLVTTGAVPAIVVELILVMQMYLGDGAVLAAADEPSADPSTVHAAGPSTLTVQTPSEDERPPSGESSTAPSNETTVQRPPAPSSDRPRRASTVRPKPSTPAPSTGQPDKDVWVEIGHPVYLTVRDRVGKRPPEGEFQEALAAEAARLVALGQLPDCYAEPSLSTAKRVRKDVETRFPELSPLHLIREAS